jgi:hypothetical protein
MSLTQNLINLDNILPIESVFFNRFYVRSQLLKKEHDKFNLLNLPIDIAIKNFKYVIFLFILFRTN